MSRPAAYPRDAFAREAPRKVQAGWDASREVGSFRKGNRNSSYLGRSVVCVADLPRDWHGEHYGKRPKPARKGKVTGTVSARQDKPARKAATPTVQSATVYAWGELVRLHGEREASQRFRRVAGRSADELAAQHGLAGYVAA